MIKNRIREKVHNQSLHPISLVAVNLFTFVFYSGLEKVVLFLQALFVGTQYFFTAQGERLN